MRPGFRRRLRRRLSSGLMLLMAYVFAGWLAATLTPDAQRAVPDDAQAMLLSLLWTQLPARQRLTVAWFGPRGFASVVYGLLAPQSGLAEGQRVFDLIAITIALSVELHSSTDVPVAKMLQAQPATN